jgi:hypothetical protein
MQSEREGAMQWLIGPFRLELDNACLWPASDSGQSIKKVLTKNANCNKNNTLASNTDSLRRVNRVVLLQLRPLWCRCL